MIKKALCILLVVGGILAAPAALGDVQVIRYDYTNKGNGNYAYTYEFSYSTGIKNLVNNFVDGFHPVVGQVSGGVKDGYSDPLNANVLKSFAVGQSPDDDRGPIVVFPATSSIFQQYNPDNPNTVPLSTIPNTPEYLSPNVYRSLVG